MSISHLEYMNLSDARDQLLEQHGLVSGWEAAEDGGYKLTFRTEDGTLSKDQVSIIQAIVKDAIGREIKIDSDFTVGEGVIGVAHGGAKTGVGR